MSDLATPATIPSTTEQIFDWLDCIGYVNDPWQDWLGEIKFPHGPLDSWLELHIKDAFHAADERRLATDALPKTERFAAMWESFRKSHEVLDDGGKHRRNRYWIWRAAVLKIVHDRDGCFLRGRGFPFQDEIDRRLAHDKFREAMDGAGGVGCYRLDGSPTVGDHNFWRSSTEWPIHDYAAMVLSLVRAVT